MTRSYIAMRLETALYLICATCLLLQTGCVTTNYYTARTLTEGETVLTPGVDNLVWIENDGKVVEKHFSFSVSLGVATGLPWRFETGLRGYFPYIYEANIRHQINPSSFKIFDISANFHTGIVFTEKFKDISHPYIKYGLTVSKEIASFQPYLSYFLSTNYIIENSTNEAADYSIICFGIAIPFKTDFIFPECNYYRLHQGAAGYFSLGIGLRVSLDSPALKNKQK
jgi:hypothetical protein